MAINYTNLFGDISEIISAIEEIETFMSTMDSRRSAMITQFTSSGVTELITNVNETFSSIEQLLENMTTDLVSLASLRLTERETVLEELPELSDTSSSTVIEALIADMQTNSETVKESTVTLTPGTPVSTNTNVGELITTKLLPGNTAPGDGFQENRFMAGLDTELPLDDEVKIICENDSQQGSQVGSEQFLVTGTLPQQLTPFAFNQGGNLGSASINLDSSYINNFFETFTDDIPNDWDKVIGGAGSTFQENTTESVLGSNSLEFITGTTQLCHAIYSYLVPGETLVYYMWVKRSAGAGGSLAAMIYINTNNILTLSETIDATFDDWALMSGVFTVPDNIGDNVIADTKISLTATSITAPVYVDAGGLSPMTYFGGVGVHVVPGPDKFLLDDTFPLTIANDEAGKIQRFFTRAFGFQLPSATSGSETISDPT
jgi:hypothetical protein